MAAWVMPLVGAVANRLSSKDADERNAAASRVQGTMGNQNAAVRQAAAGNALGALGTNAVNTNPYAGNKPVEPIASQQRSDGWGQTQRYLGGLSSLQSGNGKGNGNGLQKVLGLVSLFGGKK